MKRWFSLLLALLCAFSTAQAEQTLFSMPCPDGWLVDEESHGVDDTESDMWMCTYYTEDEKYIDVFRCYVSDWANVTLYSGDNETISLYKQESDTFYGETAMALANVTGADGNEFLVYAASDEYGIYVIALTLVNGWEVSVTLQAAQATLQVEDLTVLTDMLCAFTLLTEPSGWTAPETTIEGGYRLQRKEGSPCAF